MWTKLVSDMFKPSSKCLGVSPFRFISVIPPIMSTVAPVTDLPVLLQLECNLSTYLCLLSLISLPTSIKMRPSLKIALYLFSLYSVCLLPLFLFVVWRWYLSFSSPFARAENLNRQVFQFKYFFSSALNSDSHQIRKGAKMLITFNNPRSYDENWFQPPA